VATAFLTLLTLTLLPMRGRLSLASVVLLYLAAVVATAVLTGLAASLCAAVASELLVDFFFVPPFHRLSVLHQQDVITLLVYAGVAGTVSVAVDIAAQLRASANRSGVETDLLARISAEPVRAGSTHSLLEHAREVLRMTTAALVSLPDVRDPTVDHDGLVIAIAGPPMTGPPTLSIPAGDHLALVVEGPPVFAPDPRFLTRLAAATARAWETERLAAEAVRARELAEIDRLRSALLAAVGHDLRTPLAGIKAGASSLRDPELRLTADQQAELVATIDESADRMIDLVENLLAMSRLQAGALSVHSRPVALDEVVAAALLHQTHGPTPTMDVPDDLPLALADPGLLERVVANLVSNAQAVSPTVHLRGRTVPTGADGTGTPERLRLSVIDTGPGIALADRDRVFLPFHRLDDRHSSGGMGLGLAIARGFVEAMSGTLVATDTPGGGATMTIDLPVARQNRVGGGASIGAGVT
jgi:two-component system sensor histidine kinase KdpD